jgi:5-dehydro-2-deoxygluconokinase
LYILEPEYPRSQPGDAFGGPLAHALVHGCGLRTALELAKAAGALAASRLACADDFGTLGEIESLLNISPRPAA